MADLTGFKARFSEFSALGISDATIQVYLDDSIDHLSESAWGDCYDRAVYFYTAHVLTINQRRTEMVTDGGLSAAAGKSGLITSSSADGLSVSFESGYQSGGYLDDYLRQTSYGQEYLALRDECILPASITICQ